jgi:hypothetical protein
MLTLKQGDGWEVLRDARDDEPAVEVQFGPITRGMKLRAYRRALGMLDGADVSSIDKMALGDMGDAFSYELLRLGIKAWSGVGDENGEPVAITPAMSIRFRTSENEDRPMGTIDAFLSIEDLFDEADRIYVMPVVERDRSKNALSASPNGIGGAEMQDPAIAGSSATPPSKAAAKSASTGSMRRKAPRKTRSGAS